MANDQDQGITAYHGSPHDFEQFDTSKIGTGEGAQAYGHGLYFAEHEPVAKGYRDKLTQDYVHVNGEKLLPPSDENPHTKTAYALANQMQMMGWNVDDALKFAEEHAKSLEPDLNSDNHYKRQKAEYAQKWLNEVKPFAGKTIETKKDLGHMYEVHINAHPDHFLDWEKPLSAQSQHVKNALAKFGVVSNDEQARANYDALERALTDPDFMDDLPKAPNDPYGHKIYTTLREKLHLNRSPAKPFKRSDADTAKSLSKVGIRGIRYLDAGSRNDGEGTHNYVVFDHKHVKIRRKYKDGGDVEKYPLRNHTDWEEAHDYEKTGGKLHYEKPDEYLDSVKPLDMDHHDKKVIRHFEQEMKKGEKQDPLAIYPDNHPNGRHRAHAAQNLGIKKVPVVTWDRKEAGGPVVDRALMVISKKV